MHTDSQVKLNHAIRVPPSRLCRVAWCVADLSTAWLRCAIVVTGVIASAGCVSVQQASPALAPYLAGRMTCPHCGLLKEQGCRCHPDLWNHGYRPTDWRLMSGIVLDERAVPQETLPPALNAPSSVESQDLMPDDESQPRNEPEPPPVHLDMDATTMSAPQIDLRNR